MSNKIKQKKGFTIIEVVLVLAIAGLIFLMVFIVLPQAMAGQRDGERRQAMSRVQSALVQYQTNNKSKRNNLPNDKGDGAAYAFDPVKEGFDSGTADCDANIACSFIKNYLNTTEDVARNVNMFLDPDGVPYNIVITKNWNLTTDGKISPTSIASTTNSGSSEGSGSSESDGSNQPTAARASELVEAGGDGYTIGGSNPLSEHVIYIVTGARCDGERAVKSDLRHFAVLYRLENSSVYCGDSD